jgi:hypothetical protein
MMRSSGLERRDKEVSQEDSQTILGFIFLTNL